MITRAAWICPSLALATLLVTTVTADDSPSFRKVRVSEEYYSEGANTADVNRDGQMDVIYGPYWYAGPEFRERHEIYPPKAFPNDRGYADNFFAFPYDFTGDEWTDVVMVGLPGTPAYLYENPGDVDRHWIKHEVFPVVDNESPTVTDLTGDGRPEIVCSYQGRLGYAAPADDAPTGKWTFHPISAKGPWQKYTHGLGVADVDGDGRKDFLMKDGWWRQPESLKGDPEWEAHPFVFSGKRGGSQMFAWDIDGDGDNDVLTSLDAHGWGLSWYEQVEGEDGGITFKPHQIMGEKPSESPHGVAFSQLHAMDVADVDGDGLLDLVAGKCYWAHNGRDPGARDPSVVVWFRLTHTPDGVDFVPHQIDDDSGVGRQIAARDVNGDGRVDIITGNKKGAYVFLREAP